MNSGSYGFVYLCKDLRTGELVAIKFIERGEKVTKASCCLRQCRCDLLQDGTGKASLAAAYMTAAADGRSLLHATCTCHEAAMAMLPGTALKTLLLRTHCGCAAVCGAGATKSQPPSASSHCAVSRGKGCRDARPASLHCWYGRPSLKLDVPRALCIHARAGQAAMAVQVQEHRMAALYCWVCCPAGGASCAKHARLSGVRVCMCRVIS